MARDMDTTFLTEIILSVRDPYARMEFEGLKTLEVRLKRLPNCRAYIYDAGPTGSHMILGHYYILWSEPVNYPNIELYSNHLERACLTLAEYQQYVKGRTGYFHLISHRCLYKESLPLSYFGLSRPPQSWQYVRSPGRIALDLLCP